MKLSLSLIVLLVCCSSLNAQFGLREGRNFTNLQDLKMLVDDDDDDEDEEEVEGRGWSFGLNLGAYIASKKTGNFYNGTCAYALDGGPDGTNCNTIEGRLTLNQATISQVQNLLNVTGILDYEAPLNMGYQPAITFGLGIKYSFNFTNSIVFDLNTSRLALNDIFTMTTNESPDGGIGSEDIRQFAIVGKENRLSVNLGYQTGMYINDEALWIFELGGTALGAKVTENLLRIESQSFDLLVIQNGALAPNRFNATPTSWGYGAFLGTGASFVFKDNYEMTLGARWMREKVSLYTLAQEFETTANNFLIYARFSI